MSSSQSEHDVESAPSPLRRRLAGYPSFAHFVAKDKDAAIFRKFQHLSSRSLLYQQSYLHSLEEKLLSLDEDVKCLDNEEAQKVARHWDHYSATTECAVRHRELQQKIKVAIKEYRTYVSLQCIAFGRLTFVRNQMKR